MECQRIEDRMHPSPSASALVPEIQINRLKTLEASGERSVWTLCEACRNGCTCQHLCNPLPKKRKKKAFNLPRPLTTQCRSSCINELQQGISSFMPFCMLEEPMRLILPHQPVYLIAPRSCPPFLPSLKMRRFPQTVHSGL